jgi:nucleotide-binding universal stress UspA family protein
MSVSPLPRILLVPVDGSKNAVDAAVYAATLAAALSIPIRLLFAFPEDPRDWFGFPMEGHHTENLRLFEADTYARFRENTARKIFDAARAAMAPMAVTIETQMLGGEPARSIVEHAQPLQGAMIVMGRRGLSSLKELILGSTTQRVMHQAHCPVLVVQ